MPSDGSDAEKGEPLSEVESCGNDEECRSSEGDSGSSYKESQGSTSSDDGSIYDE